MIAQVLFFGFELAVPFIAVVGGIAVGFRAKVWVAWFSATALLTIWVIGLIMLVTAADPGPVSAQTWVWSVGPTALGVVAMFWGLRRLYLHDPSVD